MQRSRVCYEFVAMPTRGTALAVLRQCSVDHTSILPCNTALAEYRQSSATMIAC